MISIDFLLSQTPITIAILTNTDNETLVNFEANENDFQTIVSLNIWEKKFHKLFHGVPDCQPFLQECLDQAPPLVDQLERHSYFKSKTRIFSDALDAESIRNIENLESTHFEAIVNLKVWVTKFKSLMQKPIWQSIVNESADKEELFEPLLLKWTTEENATGYDVVENDQVERHTYFKYMTQLCLSCEDRKHEVRTSYTNPHGNEVRIFKDDSRFYNNSNTFNNIVIVDTKDRVFTHAKKEDVLCDLYISPFANPGNEVKNNPRKYVHVQYVAFGEDGKTFFENIHVRNEPIHL